MKRVQINYRNANGEYRATGKTNDLAIRQIFDANTQPIHTAKGRLSLDALLKRASKTGVTILDINVNGSFTYKSEGGQEKKEEKREEKKDQGFKYKFMVSRYTGKCYETGKSVKKGDVILYEQTNKHVYCKDSVKYDRFKDDKSIYGQGLTITKEQEQGSQDSGQEQQQEAKAEPKVESKSDGRVKVESTGDGLIDMIAAKVAESITASDIDQTQVDAMIAKALSAHSKIISVKREDLPPIELGTQHYMFEELLLFAANRINVQLTGAAGSGKTFAASQVAKALDLPYYAISVGAMTTKTDFQGYNNARGEYVITLFRQAFEHGGVFLLDEMDAGNANVITTINMALSNGVAAFPDGMVNKHDDFVLIAGANTYGNGADRMYVGRNQLDAASIDRFAVIDWDYDEGVELAISCNQRWTRYVQKCRANMNRMKMRFVISPRASVNGGIMLKAGLAVDRVKQTILFKSMSEADVKKVTDGVTY